MLSFETMAWALAYVVVRFNFAAFVACGCNLFLIHMFCISHVSLGCRAHTR